MRQNSIPDWDIDYDEPEVPILDPDDMSPQQQANIGLLFPGGRMLWRKACVTASAGRRDPVRVLQDYVPWDDDFTHGQWALMSSELLLEAAVEALPQLAAIYYDAGLYGTQREPGPPVEPFLEAAFAAGVAAGEKLSSYEHRRWPMPSGRIIDPEKRVPVVVELLTKDINDLETAVWGVRIKDPQLNRDWQNIVIQTVLLDGAIQAYYSGAKPTKDFFEFPMVWGGAMWISSKNLYYNGFESPAAAVDAYLTSGMVCSFYPGYYGASYIGLKQSFASEEPVNKKPTMDNLERTIEACLGSTTGEYVF